MLGPGAQPRNVLYLVPDAGLRAWTGHDLLFVEMLLTDGIVYLELHLMVVVEKEPVQCSYHNPFGVGNALVAPYVVRIRGDD